MSGYKREITGAAEIAVKVVSIGATTAFVAPTLTATLGGSALASVAGYGVATVLGSYVSDMISSGVLGGPPSMFPGAAFAATEAAAAGGVMFVGLPLAATITASLPSAGGLETFVGLGALGFGAAWAGAAVAKNVIG